MLRVCGVVCVWCSVCVCVSLEECKSCSSILATLVSGDSDLATRYNVGQGVGYEVVLPLNVLRPTLLTQEGDGVLNVPIKI